jgi:hypothetical protein
MVRKSEDEESGLDKLMVDCCVASPWKRMEGRLAGKKNDLDTMTLVRNEESGLDKSLVDCCVASESSLCRFESDASFLGTPWKRGGGKGLARCVCRYVSATTRVKATECVQDRHRNGGGAMGKDSSTKARVENEESGLDKSLIVPPPKWRRDVSKAPPKRWRDERMKSPDQHHGGVWTNRW